MCEESKLKKQRQQSGMSQQQLAYRSGVDKRTIQNYEQGKRSMNNGAAILVYKLAKALKIGIEDLLDLNEIKK